MTKDELQSIGLNDEQMAEVFRLNGLAVENARGESTNLEIKLKELEAEKTKLESQIETANEQIEGFKDVDLDEMENEIDKYKRLYEESETEFESKLEKVKTEQELKLKILETKPYVVEDVISKFNEDNIKITENGILGFEEEISRIKTEYPHYYPKEEVKEGLRSQDPYDPARDDLDGEPSTYEDFLNQIL